MNEHSTGGKTPKSDAMAEHENMRRRMRLQHKSLRQEAVAAWPLMVASIALDMKRLLEVQKDIPPGDYARSVSLSVDYIEKQIRESFIQQFGFDMVPAEPSPPKGD